MTIRDFPRHLHPQMVNRWVGDDNANEAYVDWVSTLGNPMPDRAGLTNPDDVTTRWEWDTELTAQEAADFDAIVKALTMGGATGPSPTEVGAAIDQMQAFLNRPQTPTDTQRDDTMDAILTYLKHLHATR